MLRSCSLTFIFYTEIFFLFFCHNTLAQTISFVPPCYNYNSNVYKAGNQNWSVAQGKDGVIYAANDDGLLSFDGVNWKLHEMPGNRGVKSILIDTTSTIGKIYVGSFEEFGYFEKDATNQLVYHSLKPLIKNYVFMNDEIWTISRFRDEIFFQSFSSYFIYNNRNRTVKSFKPSPGPLYFFCLNNTLYAQFIDGNFSRYDGNKFIPILSHENLRNDVVVGILPNGQNLLLFLSKKGVLEYDPANRNLASWNNAIDEQLKNTTINRVLSVSDSTFVLGTLDNGMYAFSIDGTLKWHLNKSTGLNNNTILGLFADKDENIWVALDNGISYVQTRSPISLYEPFDVQIGLVEGILINKNAVYLATNQGIYKYINNHLSSLPGFEIQSWFIRKFGNQVIVGHNKGTSFMENDRNIPITESNTGGTDIKNVKLHDRDILLQSTYTALQVYTNDNGYWKFSHKISGFFDLISQIEVDHTGNIWAAHMYKGVYRLRVDQSFQKITDQQYFPAFDTASKHSSLLRIMKLRGRMVFTDQNKFYTYDDISQKIISFSQLNEDLPDLADTYRIVPVNDTVYWFVRNAEYTLIKYADSHFKVEERITFASLNNPPSKRRGNVYVDDRGVSYFCLNGGIGKYVPSAKTQVLWQKLALSGALTSNRKETHSRFLAVNSKNIIPYSDNNLFFHVQYPNYLKKKITIQRRLEGYDSQWMPIDNNNLTINYTNLPAGNYVLNVRALSEDNKELSSVSSSFLIKNPWYRTTLAFSAYITLLLLVAGLIIRSYLNKVIRKKNKLFAQQEKERVAQLDRQEKLITEMKNEKLQNELTYKSKELANATMMVINHEELLNKLKKEIQENVRAGRLNRSHGTRLVKMIDSNISAEDEWALFQENFDLIHENFFRKLTEQYPELTSGDLRLCALLRLNYSSKEIAKMLNLTLRGVEAARYRLRKKLGMKEEESLVSFMINFN